MSADGKRDDGPDAWLNHSSHWGAFRARARDGEIDIASHPDDPAPSPMLENFRRAAAHPARIRRPAVRRGWLENGPGADARRGRDVYVEMDWPEVLDRVAGELGRVYRDCGADAVFGGSYGWSSAGRFHHAQSQLHRFLNALGGYVRSVNTYSAGAAAVILPRVFAPLEKILRASVTWTDISRHCDLLVAFGGMPSRNTMVAAGGVSRHVLDHSLRDAVANGTQLVLISPLRNDISTDVPVDWLAPVPGTDTALMLAIAHTLIVENLHDRAFIDSHSVGFDTFAAYVLGQSDGVAKTPQWAASICGLSAETVTALARRMAQGRTLITFSQSMQRAEHGEQPIWLGLVLAVMLGQLGLPGGGYHYSIGSMGNVGKPVLQVPLPTLSQGVNAVEAFIPVARIADMLLHPGERYDYNGQSLCYPQIRLAYWAGGNPFHHHQDLQRLQRAFAKLDTLIVHESVWTSTARHADIVLPCTLTLERNDIGAAQNDAFMQAMHRIVAPHVDARDDYAIFAAIADRLGVDERFTEGRSADQWLEHLYAQWQEQCSAAGVNVPSFATFWQQGELPLPVASDTGRWLQDFQRDPLSNPLPTASGRVEIFSEIIAGFDYADCAGHPSWIATKDDGGDATVSYPLHLIANQPATRLHSQLDFTGVSLASKIRGREPAHMHAVDAASRGIVSGDLIRIFNGRGACLAGVIVSENVRPGVIQLSTGAWYDPHVLPGDDSVTCVHGNPNVLTRDYGTSSLAQGCTGQLSLVEVERFDGTVPAVKAFEPPVILRSP